MSNAEMNNAEQYNSEQREILPAWRVDRSVPVPVPDRATRVASWVGWHLPELAGVTVPAVAAVAVSPWAWLVSGAVGAGWTVHTVRQARAQAAIQAGRDLPATADTVPGKGSEVEEVPDGPAVDPDDMSTADADADGSSVERDARGLA